MKPALTEDQWRVGQVMFRRPRGRYDEGYGIERSVGPSDDAGTLWVWDDSWGLTLDRNTQHATAALCLYGQEFGFTVEDVIARAKALLK